MNLCNGDSDSDSDNGDSDSSGDDAGYVVGVGG